MIAAHCEVAAGGTRLLTIIAPRHRERGDAIAALAEAAGLSIGRRSRGDEIGDRTDLYLADTIGEMGLWYRLADVAFLGGSIALRGGQNPIEPAKLGVPILHGSDLGNFRDVYKALTDAGATVMVSDAVTLAASLKRLLGGCGEREGLARQALAVVGRFTGCARPHARGARAFPRPLGHSHEARAARLNSGGAAAASPATRWRRSALSMERSRGAGWRRKAYVGRIPVICVGNLVVGGAGKTPTALEVANVCRKLGLRPGFLTRGYRGKETGPLLVFAGDPFGRGCRGRSAAPGAVRADRSRRRPAGGR